MLSQTQIWDHYIALNGIKMDKLTTFQCVWQLEGRGFIFRCCWYMVGLLTSLAVPFIISALSDFYEDESASIEVGLWLSLGLWGAVCILFHVSNLTQFTFHCFSVYIGLPPNRECLVCVHLNVQSVDTVPGIVDLCHLQKGHFDVALFQ